jgi:hypothetical protein
MWPQERPMAAKNAERSLPQTGNMNSQAGTIEFESRISNVANGSWSASATPTYHAS